MEEYTRYSEQIESKLNSLALPGNPARLYDPIRYSLRLKGKRLRPVLTLAACDLFGGQAEDAIDAAAGIEIFHNFTLLHDDIMDQAPLRRGKETVYKKWNTNVAILSGDTMFALAYRLISAKRSDNLKDILDTFTQAAIEVCEGQQIDMDFETATNVTIPAYIEMIRLKTAVLLGACLKIGALSANADIRQADLLYDFGIYAGLAFQLQDDLLDAFASNEKFGKSIGGDILANKKTFLYLKCLELASQTDHTKLSELFSGSISYDPEVKILRVLEIYNRYNIRQLAKEEMERYFNKAISCLHMVKADEHKKAQLRNYAEWLYKRDY